jgi:NAD(P)H-hydrate epimerase
MMAENESFTGRIHSIDIGLSKRFEDDEPSEYSITVREDLKKMIKSRPLFAHKGSFGHGALVAGSHGMMGAAILAASGFLRSGAGKLTCYVPECGYEIMQTSVPEAMCETSGNEKLLPFALKIEYDAIGAGPGISPVAATAELLNPLLRSNSPLVLDADALNGMAKNEKLLDNIPSTTIITPHPGEFDRLFGKTNNDFERLALAISSAKKHGLYIVLKGHHTATCTPEGKVHFNDTGNPGMAKPGMGDVLTGLMTGLLAQGYAALEACLLGVHIHGRAGDLAAIQHSQQAMTAMHLVDELENVWKEFS